MLLKNSPSKYKLVNGSIGIMKKIMFEHRNGPRYIPYELPACIIVKFKESNFLKKTNGELIYTKKNSFQLLL